MSTVELALRTESRIKHVEGHLVTLLGSGDCYEALVAVILWFVNLNNTSAELSNFVDLGSSLANDCSNHVIGNEDLLRQRLTRYHTLHRLGWWPSMTLSRLMACVLHRLMRTSCSVTRLLRRTTVMHRSLRLLLRWLSMEVRDTVRISRCTISLVIMSLEVIGMAIVTAGRLGYIWHDLHAARNNTRRSTATCGIRRCCRASKALRQLFHKSLSDVVGCYMNSIGDTKDYKRSLG